jgi:hypothetical protein
MLPKSSLLNKSLNSKGNMIAEVFREELMVPSDRLIVAYDGMPWSDIMNTAREVATTRVQARLTRLMFAPGLIMQLSA